MSNPFKIVAISGSLRKGSYNTAALRTAQTLANDKARIELANIQDLPLFNEDLESAPPVAVNRLREQVKAADGILISTPEYNYSTSGVLKNAIDWLSRPYGQGVIIGKPAAIMGASISAFGTARAQYDVRKMFVTLNMTAVNQPEVMIASAMKVFDKDGNLTDASTKDRIGALVTALCGLIAQLKK